MATYCLSHTIVLTHRCAYQCGYCDFGVRSNGILPSSKMLQKQLRSAAGAGVAQVQMVAGEGIAEHSEVASVIRFYGLDTYEQYLRSAFHRTMTSNGRPGLLPVPNLGNLSLHQLQEIRRFVPCVRILLESCDPRLMTMTAHSHSPGKAPDKRLTTILNAGQARIPVSTGILVGIGESRASREKTLALLYEAHRRHGHIQNIAIERFQPRPGTAMQDWAEPTLDEWLEPVAIARRMFGKRFPITVRALDDLSLIEPALQAGANDFGDVELTGETDSDRQTLLRLRVAKSILERNDKTFEERLPVFDSHLNEKWLSADVLGVLELHAGMRRA